MQIASVMVFLGLWLAGSLLVYGALRRAFGRINARANHRVGAGGGIFVSSLAGLVLAMGAIVTGTLAYHGFH
ncbi:MAG: hypothetical protein N3D18_11765 [Roseococcus sp.]|nr:hypothetical protein [Roseococcus sp.]